MNRLIGHFTTITQHKLLVMKGCFQIGLYKQGLLHDMSKYSPVEFLSGVKYYQGFRSPINEEKEQIGYSLGWLHHKGKNKHHFEYWTDLSPVPGEGMIGVKMPRRYLAEMFIDRVSAGKIYKKEEFTTGSPLEYFLNGKQHCVMHPDTSDMLEKLLRMYKVKGEAYTFRYIRKVFLKDPEADY
ncbi:MAG: DUF5662 family protein [Lachnospiraceae bacterium]|nr:DUF5662 family protein [Lachnospiraceae bacterium]